MEKNKKLKTMFITNNIEVAKIAQKYGVDRIWIDLEVLGKEERQKGMNTVKSNHTIEDIKKIRPYLNESELLVRINPINKNSKEEIEKVIEVGADIIMLPMWKSVEEVKQFISLIENRVQTTLLLETKEAVECLDEVLKLDGINEIHIGLNDLHLSYGLKFMFEPLVNGLVENICKKIKEKGLPYGFGGIAKIGEGMLPAEDILEEHFRLGSSRIILSRSFCNLELINSYQEVEEIFSKNIEKLKQVEKILQNKSIKELEEHSFKVKRIVEEIIKNKQGEI
jgi:2-keto-3-deoxy-L-rhamnonate aldolase RhmA